jgi:prepilin-type N-terminal cleavage/methylation domain-containing protein
MHKRGFTLIETVIGSVVFAIIALSSYQAFSTLMNAVVVSQAKLAATELVNEQIEIIRNLPYTDVGLLGGIPAGKINRNQGLIKNNFSFNLETTIRNMDDTYDGIIGGNPNDTSPADYKLVDFDLTCTNCKNFTPLKFTTLVAPHALETASTNGALFVRVFDAGGIPVPGASIHIVNTATNPDTIIDESSDNAGWLKIVDAPTGTNTYNISVTKSGYSQDQTYPIGGGAGPNPVKPDSTVVVQQVTQSSFSIDQLSSLNISTVDDSCNPFPNIGFSLTGTKLIGTPSVIKYPTTVFSTNTVGTYVVNNLEWDNYQALLTSNFYDLAGTTFSPNFDLDPNENKNMQLLVVAHQDKALLVSVKDSNGDLIDGASVRLERGAFDDTKTTSSSGGCPTPGQAFWNNLVSGTYTLTVSKAGYTTYTNNSLDISPNWQNLNVTLSP